MNAASATSTSTQASTLWSSESWSSPPSPEFPFKTNKDQWWARLGVITTLDPHHFGIVGFFLVLVMWGWNKITKKNRRHQTHSCKSGTSVTLTVRLSDQHYIPLISVYLYHQLGLLPFSWTNFSGSRHAGGQGKLGRGVDLGAQFCGK